jgi:RNA polymerase sigma factor (sigma-70 family)
MVKSRPIREEDILYVPTEMLDKLECSLKLSEMERSDLLGSNEWMILENLKILSNREKQCIYLYYWKRYSQVEIAKKLSIKQQTVSEYLNLGRNKIKKHFKQKYLNSISVVLFYKIKYREK